MVRFVVNTMVDIALGRRPPAGSCLLAATNNLASPPPPRASSEAVQYPDLYAEESAMKFPRQPVQDISWAAQAG
jgi:hypothetical protein